MNYEIQDQPGSIDSQYATISSPSFDADAEAKKFYTEVEAELTQHLNRFFPGSTSSSVLQERLEGKFKNRLQTLINPFTNAIDQAQIKLSHLLDAYRRSQGNTTSAQVMQTDGDGLTDSERAREEAKKRQDAEYLSGFMMTADLLLKIFRKTCFVPWLGAAQIIASFYDRPLFPVHSQEIVAELNDTVDWRSLGSAMRKYIPNPGQEYNRAQKQSLSDLSIAQIYCIYATGRQDTKKQLRNGTGGSPTLF